VEPLVNRDTEHYPRGGIKYLVCFPPHMWRNFETDAGSPGKRSRHASQSRNTGHPRSSRASWCPGGKPDVYRKVRPFLQEITTGNLMSYLKLYLRSPVLCGYFRSIFQLRCLNWELDRLQLRPRFDLDCCHDVHVPPSSPI
jgi:hypothetical protein